MIIIIAALGISFWGGLVFFSFRKSLLEKKSNVVLDYLRSLKEQYPQLFLVSSGVFGFLAIVGLIIFYIRSSNYAGMIGPSLMIAMFSSIATGASIACALYMDE